MRLQQNHRFVLSLTLGTALILGAVLPTAAAPAPPPPTLTGETLTGSGSSNSLGCPTDSFAVSGTASTPYPGMFTENGTVSINTGFAATFTITATDGTVVTGQKLSAASQFRQCVTSGFINPAGGPIPYTATIHTPSGNYLDQGTSTIVSMYLAQINGSSQATLTETFTSSLPGVLPTTQDQCKESGWQNYPQFKNQGQCVSFVEHQGK